MNQLQIDRLIEHARIFVGLYAIEECELRVDDPIQIGNNVFIKIIAFFVAEHIVITYLITTDIEELDNETIRYHMQKLGVGPYEAVLDVCDIKGNGRAVIYLNDVKTEINTFKYYKCLGDKKKIHSTSFAILPLENGCMILNLRHCIPIDSLIN